MYLDAVKMQAAKASYGENPRYTPFDKDSLYEPWPKKDKVALVRLFDSVRANEV